MPTLPSLHALRAFEASARLGSFKAAARELFVTPAAVSQQIKLLEEELGTRLFTRMNRAVALTEAGQALAPPLREAFERIAEAVRRLPGRERPGTLTISVLPSFAAKWLVPRLGRFQERHPEIDVRISATLNLADFRREDVDLAIRHGRGHWEGLTAVRLFAEDLIPVCSPRLLRGRHPLRTPQDLRRFTLLHDDTPRHWELWLQAHGVTGVNAARGPVFNDASMVLQAAMDGLGVALSPSALAAGDLARGALVQPFGLRLPKEFAYYLVCPAGTEERPKIRAFREWILAETAAGERGATERLRAAPRRPSRPARSPAPRARS